jgi:hypothetical protein
MKYLRLIALAIAMGYAVQKGTYSKTLVFQDRWANIIRHTIGVLAAFPMIYLTFRELNQFEGEERLTLAYFLAFPAFGCGVVFANLTDHPDILDSERKG